MAALGGLAHAPVDSCRVLELGCGDGGNLIPMAMELPGARFTGIDLAEGAIGRGIRTIEAVGLRNIELRAGDLARVDGSWGEFDYIITHGLYSWTAPAVRERILRISTENLAPEGVAYISYNALPGGRVRQMLREMMLFQAEEFDDPRERVGQAKALLHFVATARARLGQFNQFVADEITRMEQREDWALFHDELGEIYEPFYFQQFLEDAGRHGLQYLAEASLPEMQESGMTREAVATLDAIAGDERILREQYADLAKFRCFRQTLLCHEGRRVDVPPRVERVAGLYASTAAVEVGEGEYEGLDGARMKTADPWFQPMMDALVEASPGTVRVAELECDLGLLLMASLSGVTELHTSARPLTNRAGARPEVSPLARYQAAQGLPIATLHHATLILEDAGDLELVRLLDGTRTRGDLRGIADLDERLARLGRAGVIMSSD